MIDNQESQQSVEALAGKRSNAEDNAKTAQAKKTRITLVIFIIAGVLAIGYVLFFSGDDKSKTGKKTVVVDKVSEEAAAKEIQKDAKTVTAQQETDVTMYDTNPSSQNNVHKPILSLPLEDVTPPAPPPAPPPPPPSLPPALVEQPQAVEVVNSDSGTTTVPVDVTTLDVTTPDIAVTKSFNDLNPEKAKMDETKRKSEIFVFGSGGTGGNNEKPVSTSSTSTTQGGYLGFDGGVIDGEGITDSAAPNTIATQVRNLDRTILAGKIITAVLETAVNTDLAGSVRAIITRNVYAEYGRSVLLPKGSKILGSYQNDIKAGQVRVGIIWSRIITPQGIDIVIDSQGTDQLGRVGTASRVDTKLKEKLANAFLTSLVIPYATIKVTGNNDQVTTTTGNNGGTTTTTTAAAQVLTSGAQNFADIASESINDAMSLTPTATIEQGTRVNVTVQKDLVFPVEAVKLIQKSEY